ncbi:hypothetical protein BJ165DRAFT_1399611 [Panaeolus papilionaceus]|nr:hypothetical protein BJ165DRAFT_1399611 [Panaeolus papilionaceus]
MAGPFTSILKASPERTPSFPKLRRLYLSDIYIGASSMLFTILTQCTPNLTHLRLEPGNPHTDGFRLEVQKILNIPRARNEESATEPVSTATFPGTLERLIIHPGFSEFSGGYLTSRLIQTSSILALKRLADDPRVVICREYPRPQNEEKQEQEQLDYWLLSVAGKRTVWDEV